jgi:hypothetical protein
MRWRAVLAVLFAAVVPMAYILVGVRRRRLSDRHVGRALLRARRGAD